MNKTHLFYTYIIAVLSLCSTISLTAQNSVRGNWSPVYNSDMVPVAAANLPNGKILAWSAKSKLSFGGDEGKTYTSLFDPANNRFSTTLVTNTGHDMFCPGTANTAKGEIIVTGGSSSGKTSIYDPISNSWRTGQQMKVRRGYHAMATLSDGRVFTVGGSWSGGQTNKKAEVWTDNIGWDRLENVDSDKTVRQGAPDPGGIFRDDNHAWLFAGPGGNIFQVGPGTDMHRISTAGEGSIADIGKRADNAYSMNGNATMYDRGKILTSGGATRYSETTGTGTPIAPGSNRSYTIDISNGNTARVNRSNNMNKGRVLHNSIVLPTGQVVAIGGQCKPEIFTDICAVYEAEIWNPNNGQWTIAATMKVPRTYHSVGLLMQDGRVWAGGGGLCGGCPTNHPDAEIFSPPYLYNSNNQLATRPVINTAPTTATYNSTINVRTNSAIQSFSLVRLSSVTHSVNNEQRRVALTSQSLGGNSYNLTIPNNDWLPPGNYFLFAMNNSGVPSIAKVIKIGGTNSQLITNGIYHIKSDFTNQHVASQAGNNVGMVAINANATEQRWEFKHLGGNTYTIKNIKTNRYLEVPYARCGNGENVATWTSAGGAHQKWEVSLNGGQYILKPLHCKTHALDKSNGSNGNIKIWSNVSNNNQKFKINPAGNVSNSGPPVNCNSPQNVAIGKRASQSSNYDNNRFPVSKVVDGTIARSNFNHTRNDQNAWWEVDLGKVYDISTIQVFNRTDCCQSRLNNFHVLVSDVPFSSKGLGASINQSGVGNFHFPGAPSKQTNFNVNRKGRYVRVQLAGRNYLHLEEVKVLACDAGGTSSNCNFRQVAGAALDIGSGGGTTFVVGTNRRVYQWNGTNNWNVLPSGPLANRIDVGSDGQPWIVATDGKIYRFANNTWLRVSGWASDVGCSGNKVFVIGGSNRIYRWNGGNSWSALTGTAKKIDVWQDGSPWIVGTDDKVYQYQNNRWLLKGTFTARDISIQENGQKIWALAKSNGGVHHYLGGGNWKAYSGSANHISVNNNGNLWVVNGGRNIYINNCSALPREVSSKVEDQLYVTPLGGRKVSIQWVNDQQFEPTEYILEYAKEDGDFEPLETIATNGSTELEFYQRTHDFPITGNNHYQIKIVYPNGAEDIIPFKTIHFEALSSPIGIFPSPAQNVVNIDLQNYMDVKADYFISSLQGEIIAQGRFEAFHPEVVSLDLDLFQNGMYIITIRPEGNKSISEKLVVKKDY